MGVERVQGLAYTCDFCYSCCFDVCPVWLGYILYFVFKSKWAMGVASAYLVFWAGPFTPYFPLCIAITLSLKKLIEKIKGRGDKTSDDNKESK